jgi:uncharacterized membrane protein YfcA
MTLIFAGLFLVAVWAGIQNALAGGGTFFTFPMLLLAGLDARAANITSTIALFPGQVTTAYAGRSHVTGTADITVRALIGISLIGGIVGAALLLLTPARWFEMLVPFLVLFATGVFAWGSFVRRPSENQVHLGRNGAYAAQFAIAVYGGYFGGGIGILMLAALTAAGMEFRYAGATKNVLASVMNASAVVLFAFSHDVRWLYALIVAAGSIIGGQIGAWMLLRVNVKLLRVFVVVIGVVLGVGLFVRAYAGR